MFFFITETKNPVLKECLSIEFSS